ncbi:hypothetical protein N7U66_11985 [Lacinutrix neustonica]|uniref:Uncharacterized protein n=1 Tax=Lacinutrix neustonica TaxID=2980107 RepID=A0A9E8SCF0_9FLAO|nr:hypothetical protein [Lacinutrix neustonica]WAC00936.1 hypothetical protein N7U66_11985 [Lacinutrix neustonica]
MAFIKFLFDGKPEDYHRVISQLNTTESFDEAVQFIQTQIKPEYNFSDRERRSLRAFYGSY